LKLKPRLRYRTRTGEWFIVLNWFERLGVIRTMLIGSFSSFREATESKWSWLLYG
jgi:hypothetical protein